MQLFKKNISEDMFYRQQFITSPNRMIQPQPQFHLNQQPLRPQITQVAYHPYPAQIYPQPLQAYYYPQTQPKLQPQQFYYPQPYYQPSQQLFASQNIIPTRQPTTFLSPQMSVKLNSNIFIQQPQPLRYSIPPPSRQAQQLLVSPSKQQPLQILPQQLKKQQQQQQQQQPQTQPQPQPPPQPQPLPPSQVPSQNQKVPPQTKKPDTRLPENELESGKPNPEPLSDEQQQVKTDQTQDDHLEDLALQYEDGYIYRGQGIPPQTRHGFGVLTDPNENEVYAGFWHDNYYNGEGRLTNLEQEDGDDQEVNWQDLTAIANSWQQYEGEFKEGKMHGKGALKFKSGERYEGEFYDGMVHGNGIFFSNNEEIQGIWNQGQLVEKRNLDE